MQDWLTRLNIPYLVSTWDDRIPLAALLVLYVMAFAAVGHILLIKRDPRASLGWIVVCLGFPGLGVFFYLIFGINRIHTRAKDWQIQNKWGFTRKSGTPPPTQKFRGRKFPFDADVFRSLVNVSDAVTRRPLVEGCALEAYHNGEEAYPAMLEAIAEARQSVFLCTYIFDNDKVGREFAAALGKAARRGVEVKVILDGFGQLYTLPSAYRALKNQGVRVVKFLPLSLSKRSVHFNLRNHRKILVIDDETGFTGGMNIGARHNVTNVRKRKRVADFHVKVEGPVVTQLRDAFFEDWLFATGERLEPRDAPEPKHRGTALCRGITAGPNEDFEKLRWIVNGGFACAKKNIRIMTPYFIPDTAMITAIIAARLKGIEIEIILPQVNNLPYVGWATQAYLDEFLRYDVKIHYRPSPFAHSKLLIIDDFYMQIGSANLDPRSLRLNFEFNLEIYDEKFTAKMIRHFDKVRDESRPLTLQKLQRRPLPVKLRDAAAKLFSPYL